MVRCANCGFLCRRDEKSRELVSIELESRSTGRFDRSDPQGHSVLFETASIEKPLKPLCFVMAADLVTENKAATTGQPAIQKERECDAFIEWHQGFTPKEHKVMMFDIASKKFEIEHRSKERKDDQERHDRLMQEERNRAEKLRKEDRDLAENLQRQQNRFAIILAIVSGLIGAIGGIFSK